MEAEEAQITLFDGVASNPKDGEREREGDTDHRDPEEGQ